MGKIISQFGGKEVVFEDPKDIAEAAERIEKTHKALMDIAEVALADLKRIAKELQQIPKNDLTRAEKNICKLLVERRLLILVDNEEECHYRQTFQE